MISFSTPLGVWYSPNWASAPRWNGYRRRDSGLDPLERHRTQNIALRVGHQAVLGKKRRKRRQWRILHPSQLAIELIQRRLVRNRARKLEHVIPEDEDDSVGGANR